jgi:hypothetical protein
LSLDSVRIRKSVGDNPETMQLTHLRPAAFHANVILAVWQDGDWIGLLGTGAVSGEKRLAQPRSSAQLRVT